MQSDHGDWLVFTPDGFFDGSRRAWQLVPFRFPSEPLSLYEPEQFFSQFYQPGLLADILREGKSMREILKDRNDPRAGLDISQFRNSKMPEVTIISPKDGTNESKREAKITIEAKDMGSGIRDLRVFRNQSLVFWKHEDIEPDPKTKTYSITVPVKLVAGDNEITTYAFNSDDIKSKDASITVKGADSLKREGNAYIIAVGVNRYSNNDYNLNYAVNDAKTIAETVGISLKKLKSYSEVVPITLLDKDATKRNILIVLDLLSGERRTIPESAPKELLHLKPAEPEDVVILYFSGHGTADKERYYLIPHDMGYRGERHEIEKAGKKKIMENSISDLDLEKGFERVDAERIMLIIDACQSGQALESEEKRRGPMNSRGLAQLAYEKGMYILAAAQSYQAALEIERLEHGLLTYTLIQEGLKKMAADGNPNDGQLTAKEWLEYAVQNVPREMEEAGEKHLKKTGREIDFGEPTVTGQAPRAYYRREIGQPWVVGKK